MYGLRKRDIGVSCRRGTLGIEEAPRASHCVCGLPSDNEYHIVIFRVNIDGVWNYLCHDCLRTLHMLFLGEDVSHRLITNEEYVS